jgi:hypothetical protein
MPAEEIVATLREAWNILTDMQVPSALMGGLALAQWGHLRTTQDVDLLIALTGFRPQALLARLSAAGFRTKGRHSIVRLEDAEFIQLLYEPPGSLLGIQIDLFLADSHFHREALQRRVRLPSEVLGFECAVLACEDLIIMKLLAGRLQDRVDITALLQANRDSLDLAHLMKWVTALHLERPFHEAWNDAFPGTRPPKS